MTNSGVSFFVKHGVDFPSSCMKKTGTTEQDFLTNHKPEPVVRRHSSKSTTLVEPITIYCFSYASVSGWLHTFPASRRKAE
uniref:Ovule protein n=1 Tax=Mesocestoides corti TaxID=53468 RepID=A0A5K3FW74_MESCO